MFKFVLPLFVVFLCKQAVAQDRFIVSVSEYPTGDFDNQFIRCPATIVTNRDVLTTAACATPSNSSMQLAITIISTVGGVSRRVVGANQFIHPNYTGNVHANNVAVVRVRNETARISVSVFNLSISFLYRWAVYSKRILLQELLAQFHLLIQHAVCLDGVRNQVLPKL